MGATVNRVGTDVSVGVATVTEQAAKQVGSVAGTAVTLTGSIVVGGASLIADGVVTLASVATGPSQHRISRPAGREAHLGGQPDEQADRPPKAAGNAQRRTGTRAGPATAAATRRPATSKARPSTKRT